MKSDIIRITDDLTGKKAVNSAVDSFIAYNSFSGKNALHIRLLSEELVSMVHGIMDGFEGDFMLESNKTQEGVLCRICLSARRAANFIQEEQLLSVSSSGKNENAKGVLGKIREAFRISVQYYADERYMDDYAAVNLWYGAGIYSSAGDVNIETNEYYWSLNNYRESLSSDGSSAKEWDELEKSIIAKLADEVKVWLKLDTTELVIEKLIKNETCK